MMGLQHGGARGKDDHQAEAVEDHSEKNLVQPNENPTGVKDVPILVGGSPQVSDARYWNRQRCIANNTTHTTVIGQSL